MKLKKTRFVLFIFIVPLLLFACSSASKVQEKIKTEPVPPSPRPVQKQPEPEKKALPTLPKELLQAEANAESIQDSFGRHKNSANEKDESSLLFEEALVAYQEAQAAWEKGDLDAAIQFLDEAYSLILKANLPNDSPLFQEKNELRLLIAQKIQQIYASRLTPVGDNHKTIPLTENKWVLREIESFQTKEKKLFIEAYRRAGLYRSLILEELKQAGLPEELSWLPIIESWFKVKALSKARALGLWQFISSTGYRFGLKRDRWVDERMDPFKSTRAAVKYLDELHSFFGDWTTALAAYNCGEFRVQNIIRSQHVDYLDNFWDLYERLPSETARFVPRFIASVLIINNPEKYGFEFPEPYPPLQYDLTTVNHPAKLTSLAAALGVEASELTFLNAELRQDAMPNYDYPLRVPPGYAEKTIAVISSLPKWIPQESTYTLHSVRSGETLFMIAQRYRTTVAAIARLNGLRNVNVISPRQRLRIPGRGSGLTSTGSEPVPAPEGKKTGQ